MHRDETTLLDIVSAARPVLALCTLVPHRRYA